MANQEFKKEIRQSGVKIWQIADKIGISDITLSRKFRYEVTNEIKDEIRKIISMIKTDPAHQQKNIFILYSYNRLQNKKKQKFPNQLKSMYNQEKEKCHRKYLNYCAQIV